MMRAREVGSSSTECDWRDHSCAARDKLFCITRGGISLGGCGHRRSTRGKVTCWTEENVLGG